MTTASTTGVYYDPYDVGINADPYPTYARLREEAPVYHNERFDFWAIARHADVEAAFLDWRTFSNARGDILEIIQSGMELPPGVMMFEDPPAHTMHRGLMSRVFTPKRMLELEDQVRAYCVSCLDPLVGSDSFDIVAELGRQLPMKVISMLLGIPESDETTVRDHADDVLRTRRGEPLKIRQESIADGSLYADYIDWRAENPSDDLMTELIRAEFEDETGTVRTLTREEVLSYTQVLAGAGNETTGRLIGWLAKVLAEHPDQRRELVDDRSLIPATVDETLRFEPTGPHIARWLKQDATIDGTTIPADSAVLLLVGSANRDEARFSNADTYDIHRSDGQHLTFGYGLHFCLGAHLARLEGRVALDELLTRFPEWDCDLDSARLSATSTVRGWETLPLVIS